MLRQAYLFASQFSDDPQTQVGAIVADELGIVGRGANQLPQYVKSKPERLQRPKKYLFLEHAERDALIDAEQPQYCTLYAPWAACADCARAIINSGIIRVVSHKQIMDATPDRWMDSILVAQEMFADAGVEFEWYDGVLGDCPVLFSGELWYP